MTATHHIWNNGLLHVIVAILSLLLLAGVFGSGMDSPDDRPTTPTKNAGTGPDNVNVDDLP